MASVRDGESPGNPGARASRPAVRLLYGRTSLSVCLPKPCVVHPIHRRASKPLEDPARAVSGALRKPAGSKALRDLARGRRSACVLVCDITRPVPNGLLLPPILAELEAGGIGADGVTILVATGLHRPPDEDEKQFIVGDEGVYRSVRVESHRAEDDAMHVRLGTTSRGTPVLLDRRFLEAEVRVVTGLIEPHFMAGYSGGRKVIAPGVAHRDTILVFHSPPVMEHPRATSCALEGNPLHEDLLQISRMVGNAFAVNVVLDEDRRVVFVNAGDLERSHDQAVAAARETSEVLVPRRFHTVLTSAGGFPLDKTFYQTVKGMVTPLSILEPGGRVVVVSECSEGLGSPGFARAQGMLRALGPEGFVERISAADHRPVIDQWQTEKLAHALRRGEIHLHAPDLAPDLWADLCVNRAEDPVRAVLESVRASGDPHVAVIPEGPYVIPFWSDGAPP